MSVENKIKSVIIFAEGEIPVVGQFVAEVTDLLWPEEDADVWLDIKDRAEQLVQKTLSQQIVEDLEESLQGLKNNVTDYTAAAAALEEADSAHRDAACGYISQMFNAAIGNFRLLKPHFQKKGYEVVLLPLFVQMANMHLALHRDGCLFGKAWGWQDSIIEMHKGQLTTTISEYANYVTTTYQAGLQAKRDSAPSGTYEQKFNTVNTYIREMTLNVLDYQQLWPYLDTRTYPHPVKVTLDREIYSDAFGRSLVPIAPGPVPTQKMTKIKVWWGSKIDAVQVWYGGIETPKMGGSGGYGSAEFDLTANSIAKYWVFPHDSVWGLGFEFADATFRRVGFYDHFNWRKMAYGYWEPFEVPPGHCVSSITTSGSDLVRSILFGFKHTGIADDRKKGSLRTFYAMGPAAPHPKTTLTVPSDYKILGGGARVNWDTGMISPVSEGSLLTASFPQDAQTWVAKAKDHTKSSLAYIDVWAIAIYDPDDEWQVDIFSQTGSLAPYPYAIAPVGEGYALTGGGAQANWKTEGSLLTASYPNQTGWIAESKEHIVPEKATITAYAIGIKSKNDYPVRPKRMIETKIFASTSSEAAHPSTEISTDSGYTLIGGGANVHWRLPESPPGEGNLLTASYPDHNTWKVASKDHIKGDPCRITAFAIGVRQVRCDDLSALASAPEASGDPAGYARSDGTNSVLYRGTDKHIYELYLRGGSWVCARLSEGIGAPAASGNPAAYVRSDRTNSVVYRGENNHIYELYLEGGAWHFRDLSAIASAPAASGNPAAYVRSDRTNSVVYRGENNHIYELYLEGGAWHFRDLSAIASAPAALGDPVGYARSDGTNSVVYRGENNHIYELYLEGGSWVCARLSEGIGAPAASGDPAGYVRSDKINSIVYRGTNNHIYELYLQPGTWICGDLSGGIGAPAASGNPAAYVRSDRTNSVVYRGENNHIYELYLEGGAWHFRDLSAIASAPAASGDPAGYARSDGTNSVVHRGENNHIYELIRFWGSGQIVDE